MKNIKIHLLKETVFSGCLKSRRWNLLMEAVNFVDSLLFGREVFEGHESIKNRTLVIILEFFIGRAREDNRIPGPPGTPPSTTPFNMPKG